MTAPAAPHLPTRPKRGNREGWVRQRRGPDGQPLRDQWRGELMVGYRPDGSPDRRYLSGVSQRDVAAKLLKLRQRLAEGTLPPAHTRTLAQHLTAWLRDAVQPIRRPSTYRSCEQMARLHLIPELGHLRLSQLGPEQIRQHYAQLAGRYSHGTLQTIHKTLCACLNDAVRLRLLVRNPARGLEVPRGTGRRSGPTVLTAGEARALIAAARARPQPWPAICELALASGARQGELLALRWSDIDLQAATIRITRTRHGPSHAPVYLDPKTAAGRRTVSLTPETAAALRTYRAEQATWRLTYGPDWHPHAGGLAFTDQEGAPLTAWWLRRRLQRSLRDARLPATVRFHDLRHTHATLLLEAGQHAKLVAHRLGHSSPAITLALYAHVTAPADAGAAAAVGRLLYGAG